MRFISPKTDFAFKRIFGSEQSHEILVSFLNALLYDGAATIVSVEILNPYLVPRIRGMKDTYVDVQARLNTGVSVIIEMQVLNVEGFEKRILYNAAKKYSTQLEPAETYHLLDPVIALTLTDFVMFEQIPAMKTRFVLREKDFLLDYPANDIELVFVELPKFTKPLTDLESDLDKWLYFMRSAAKLDMMPAQMQQPQALEQAFTLANRAQLSAEEEDEIERREMWIRDQRGIMSKALKQGLQQGMEQGLQQGMEQGLQQGMEQGLQQGMEQGLQQGMEQGLQRGRKEAMLYVARTLLDSLDDAAIAAATGLSLEEIRQLR
jgi:predicted transposase/invertase (TIGR01784 family)